MNYAHCTAILLAVTLVLACVAPDAAEPVRLRSLAKGNFSGIEKPKQEIIKNKSAWEKFWAEHSARGKPAEMAPEVDFTKEMVIVALMGRQRTGGYAIEVVNVENTGNRMKVSVKRASPRPDAFTAQALSAPFHFVAIPKSDLKPEFVDVTTPAKK